MSDPATLIPEAGPFHRFVERRLRFTGAELVVPALLLFAPILALGALQGTQPWRDPVLYARLLVAVPLLLAQERVLPATMGAAVRYVGESPIVPKEQRARLAGIVERLTRSFDSNRVDGVLLTLTIVIVAAMTAWGPKSSFTGWLDSEAGSPRAITLAGWWYALTGAPIFVFLVLRAAWRVLVWSLYLWRLSRLDLQLAPTHPDRSGGLGAVGLAQATLGGTALVASALYAGVLAAEVLQDGAHVREFGLEIALFVLGALALVVSPLTLFTGALLRSKRAGLMQHGDLAGDLFGAFDRRWIDPGERPRADLLGNADPSSLADYGYCYEVVVQMRILPLGVGALTRVGMIVLAPFALLPLLELSPQEFLQRLLSALA